MTLALIALLILLPLLHLADAMTVAWAANSSAFFMQFLRNVTDVIRTLVWLAIVLMAWGGSVFWLTYAPQTRFRNGLLRLHGWSTLVLLAIVIGSLATEPLKFVVGRARPFLLEQFGPLYFQPFKGEFLYESFPSGHSMMAGIMAMSLWIFLPRLRFMTLAICLLFCFSRLAAGAHFPTDIAAGFSIGALATIWVARFLARRNIIFAFSSRKLIPVY